MRDRESGEDHLVTHDDLYVTTVILISHYIHSY
jgi:hypothetical protein